jgi:WD40 repeat protein
MNFGPGDLPNDGLAPQGFRGPGPAPIEPVPPRLADHEMLRCIGRGSYGQVWLARNMMGVYRAIKIVYRKSFGSQRPFERELAGIRRFEPISRLHQGFIDVLHVGHNEAEQYFYYIMELGDDQESGPVIEPERYEAKTLGSEIFRRGRIPLRECLDLGIAITDALAELHRHDLVHRDIKPANIIFVTGVPKLADIGLVADIKEARSYVGTEGFIPPEGPGTPRADLYSLGKVIYEASTGRDRQDFPELPTQWSGSPEYTGLLELNEVILHACKPDPQQRYESASAMNADLVLVANGKSVRRLRILEQRMANLKRFAGFAALILLAAFLLGYQVYREWRDARDARQRLVNGNLTYGNRAMESGNLLGALPYLAEALRLDEGTDRERTHRLRLGSVLAQCPKLIQVWVASNTVNTVEFSPDGRWVLSAVLDGQAEIHDVQTGKLYLQPFGSVPGLRAASFSPDGKFILTASEDGNATLWEVAALKAVFQLHHTNLIYTARFSPDGKRIVTGCGDGFVRVWDAATSELQFCIKAHTKTVTFADFSHDGKLIASASMDETARLWSSSNGCATGVVIQHDSWVTGLAFSPDDTALATCSVDRTIRVTDVESGRWIRPDMKQDDIIESVQYGQDGRMILSSGFDRTARLWSAQDFQPATSTPILAHGERLRCAAFNPDGRLVATAGNDGSVRIWDLAGSTMPPTPQPRVFCREGGRYLTTSPSEFTVCDAISGKTIFHWSTTGNPLEKALLNESGHFVIAITAETNTAAAARALQIWNTETGRATGPSLTFSNGVDGAFLSADGKKVAAWREKTAQIWDVASGTAVTVPLLHQGVVNAAQISPAGDRLATTSFSNVMVWDVLTSRLAYPALTNPKPVVHTEFSPNGRYLVTCCADQSLDRCFARVWELATGRPVGPPLWHRDGVLWANFSHDSRRIVTAGEDFDAKVWDFTRGRQVGLSLSHQGQVWAALFSSDGRWLVTASGDHTARLWDAESDDPLTPPLQHTLALTGVIFLAEERAIATTDRHGGSRVWSLQVDERPVNELTMLAQLLSGARLNSDLNTVAAAESPEALWNRFRARYPAGFSTTTNEIVAWHEHQAEQGESTEQWRAVVFHLERLMLLRPGDASLKRRLLQAQQGLKRAK